MMLADTLENYKRHEDRLIAEFTRQFLASSFCSSLDMIKWIDRQHPRKYDASSSFHNLKIYITMIFVFTPTLTRYNGLVKQLSVSFCSCRFGKVLEGEVKICQKIAQETGVLVDPMYTLAAWEAATELARDAKSSIVVMLHTGGTLGMFGLAQRYKSTFSNLKD